MKLIIKGTNSHLSEVEDWLRDEERTSGHSFICNWAIIQKRHKNRQVWYVQEKRSTVGLLAWGITGTKVHFEIFAIAPKFRHMGLGKKAIQKAIEEVKSRSFTHIWLSCSPESSEPFWRMFGFSDFPADGFWRPDHSLILPVK